MSDPKKDFILPQTTAAAGKRRRERFALLAQWYGDERAEVEISAHTPQPQSIEALIDAELARTHSEGTGVLLLLRAQWHKAVGSMFAKLTEPGSFRDGILVLEVRHSALIGELSCSLDIIKSAVNRIIAPAVCHTIRLTVGGAVRQHGMNRVK